MKSLIAVVLAAMLSLVLVTGAFAAYDSEVDYTSVMVDAAVAGDYQTGLEAEQSRNEKIDDLGLPATKIAFHDLMLLSKIMYAEAGSEWLSDEWKMCVGEVVLNRVASSEFPNTIEEVLAQPGQYYGAGSSYFNSLLPSRRCVLGAVRLLNGERLMDDAVVFQANFRQGSGIHTAFYDNLLGWTYFCKSSRVYLYGEEDAVKQVEENAATKTTEEVTQVAAPNETYDAVVIDECVETMAPVA